MNRFFFKQKFSQGKGFTLIEMLVVTLILSILIGTVLGIFISAVRLQKYTLVAQQLLNQTSYSLEYMSRTLRMAKKEIEPPSGEKNCDYVPDKYNYYSYPDNLIFKDYSDNCRAFYRGDNILWDYSDKIGYSLPLISNDFVVDKFIFNLQGETQQPFDNLQPRVTFLLEITGKAPGPQPKIKIQTTVSQRDLDIEE